MRSILVALVALAAVVSIEVAVWGVLHRSDEEVLRAADSGTPRERAFALHVLANRGDPVVFGQERVAELLEGSDELLRELAMTYSFARVGDDVVQRAYVDAHPEAVRTAFFFRHRRIRMLRRHLDDYLAASR